MIELEVWDTKQYEREHDVKQKIRSHYQICREVVQTQFLNPANTKPTSNLENFGNLCHSSPVELDGSNYKQRF